MMSDYTALDAAILEHLRIGKGHPKNSRTCQEVAIRTHPGWWGFKPAILGRLQALRKAGKIRYDRGAPAGGWVIVSPPPMADRAVIDYHTSTPAHPMTYIPETLRQAREALLQSAAALHVIAQSLEGADEPAPKSPPPDVVDSQEVEPQPDASPEPNESPVRRWIIDRPPTEEDDWVAIPARPSTDRSGFEIVAWCYAYPGTPWAPVGAIPDKPLDPTCLDRNGWIRSRLPTVEDANGVGVVLLPMGNGGVNSTIAYALIVPGQPWAPWGSNPGVFER